MKLFLGSFLAAALCAAAVPVVSVAADVPPILVGVDIAYTGTFAPSGEPQRDAIRFAEAQINATGGVHGRKVHYEIEDNGGKPETAAQLAEQLIGQGAVAIVGGNSTATSAAIARVCTNAKIPQIFMTPSAELWNTKTGVNPYVFQSTPRNEIEAPVLVRFARDVLKAKKIAILYDENPYGSSGSVLVADAAKAAGLTVADSESYNGAGSDFTPQILKIRDSGADVVFLWGANQAPAIATRQIRQFIPKANIIGGTGIVNELFGTIAGKAGDGVYTDTALNYTHPSPTQKAFLAAYHRVKTTRPPTPVAFAYDAAMLIGMGLRAAKEPTGEGLAAALVSMKPLALADGTFRYTPTDHAGLTESDIHMAIVRNGIFFNI
jgi:branched-chain amino acid transport system substrate-binding protein